MGKLGLIMLTALASFVLLTGSGQAATVIKQELCAGPAQDSSVCKTRDNGENTILKTINNAATVLAVITGVGAVIMIIIGGLTLITSAGNAENAAKARRRVIYSIVGLVVVALAWTIIHFVINRLIQ